MSAVETSTPGSSHQPASTSSGNETNGGGQSSFVAIPMVRAEVSNAPPQVISSAPDELVEELTKIRDNWGRWASWVRAVHITLTVSAVFGAAIAASTTQMTAEKAPTYLGISVHGWATLGSAVTVGILASLGIASIANRWREAWRRLTVALYLHRNKTIDGTQLIATYDDAEKLIGGLSPMLPIEQPPASGIAGLAAPPGVTPPNSAGRKPGTG